MQNTEYIILLQPNINIKIFLCGSNLFLYRETYYKSFGFLFSKHTLNFLLIMFMDVILMHVN